MSRDSNQNTVGPPPRGVIVVGRPPHGTTTGEHLVKITFKADRDTLDAISLLMSAQPAGALGGKRSEVIRRAILQAAANDRRRR